MFMHECFSNGNLSSSEDATLKQSMNLCVYRPCTALPTILNQALDFPFNIAKIGSLHSLKGYDDLAERISTVSNHTVSCDI